MTRNAKQCENYVLCRKFTDKLKSPKISLEDKAWDKAWKIYQKMEDRKLKQFVKKKGIIVCNSSNALVRLYIRKMTYIEGGNKKYQKLEVFGWYCPSCLNIEIDTTIVGMKFPFHSSWTTDDLERMWKTRTT